MSSVQFALDDGSILSFAMDRQSYSTDPEVYTMDRQSYSTDPEVYTMDNVLTDEECDHFIKEAQPGLNRAMVGAGLDPNNMDGTYSTNRTGTNCWFPVDHDEVFARVGEKIADLVGHSIKNAEQFQIVHYDVGEEFKTHYDGWDQDGTSEHFHNFKHGGNRLLTALVYLNDVEEGGGTRMTKLNVDITAQKGRLLVFEDCYKGTNNIHPLSEHAGMPVIKGEKYAFNLWFKECPYELLYKDVKPGYFEGFKRGGIADMVAEEEDEAEEEEPPMEEDMGLVSVSENKSIYRMDEFDASEELLGAMVKYNWRKFKQREIMWLKHTDTPTLIEYLEEWTKMDRSFFENIYVVKYNEKDVHKLFHDGYDLTTAAGKKCTNTLGQRVYTISIMVNANGNWEFPKLAEEYTLRSGQGLMYRNVLSENARDKQMIHKIRTNRGMIANIYIREKNAKGEILELIDDISREDPIIQPIINPIVHPIIQPINYMNIYDEVIQQLTGGLVAKNGWKSHLGFSHILRNEWKTVYPKIVDYIALRNKENVISTLNIANFEETYERKYAISAKKVLREDVFAFVKEYYQSISLQKRSNELYKFAHMELLSVMLQYELLPLLEHMTGEKLVPKNTLVNKYTKGAVVEPHTNEYAYTVYMSLSGTGKLKINPIEMQNNYVGKYHTVKDTDTYEEWITGENGLVIFKGNKHISHRTKMKKPYYYLELHYDI